MLITQRNSWYACVYLEEEYIINAVEIMTIWYKFSGFLLHSCKTYFKYTPGMVHFFDISSCMYIILHLKTLATPLDCWKIQRFLLVLAKSWNHFFFFFDSSWGLAWIIGKIFKNVLSKCSSNKWKYIHPEDCGY